MKVHHKAVDANLKELLFMVEKAAKEGATLIIAPELCLTGYSFDSTDEIRQIADTVPGRATRAVARLARQYDCFVVFGLAEKCKQTSKVYNSAVALNNAGDVVATHRKITAEKKWASDGQSLASSTFQTPLGKVGLLVCSDSYYGILPQLHASEGVNLLVVPANWPPTGLNPKELWSIRARENDIYLAACNRTGMDKTMDCTSAESVVYSPEGFPIAMAQSVQSSVVVCEVPDYNRRTRRDMNHRLECHTALVSENIRNLFNTERKRIGVSDGTKSLSDVAKSLHVSFFVNRQFDDEEADATFSGWQMDSERVCRLIVCSLIDASGGEMRQIRLYAKRNDVLFLCSEENGSIAIIESKKTIRRISLRSLSNAPVLVNSRGVQIALVSKSQLMSAQMVFALSDAGCDFVLLFTDSFEEKERPLYAVRSVEQIAVAVYTCCTAFMSMPPQSHARWIENEFNGKGVVTWTLDLSQTRNKEYIRRINYQRFFSEVSHE